MKALIFVLSVFMLSEVNAQSEEFPFPTTEAEFPGGASEMKKFIKANLSYPESAILNKEKGRVYVTFIVEADGTLTNIRVQREGTHELDVEAMRIVAMMPRWNPAKYNEENIPSRCRLPITFEMDAREFRRARKEIKRRLK